MAEFSVDAEDAHRFLRERFGSDVGEVEWVGEGAWSRCFGFVDQGRELVIRFGRFVGDFENDRRAASFASEALPVPEVLEIGEARGGYFAISSRAHGAPLESLDAAGWRAILPSLFGALGAMREADLDGTRGYGGWDSSGDAAHASWRDFLLSVDVDTPALRTHGWRRKLNDSPIGDASFRRGLLTLAELAEVPTQGRSLVHSDLINRNVLVEAGEIRSVFDWGCSLYGDFLYDVAWIAFWSPWFEALRTVDIAEEARGHYAAAGLPVPDFEARMRCCMVHIALAHQAYNAHTGDMQALADVTEQLLPFLD